MTTTEEELVYWRTLAIERGRALEELHERLRSAIALVGKEHFPELSAALGGRLKGWMREPERMESLSALQSTDVLTALDDLWKRVAADGDR